MRPTSQPGVDMLLGNLSPEERTQLADILDYIQEFAGRGGSGRLPEGSLASLLNKQTPAIRNAFSMLSEIMESPREMPFNEDGSPMEKWTEGDYASAAGLDPYTATTVKSALDGSEVAGRLQQRMGTDADRPQEPLSLREQIAAAVQMNGGTPNGR